MNPKLKTLVETYQDKQAEYTELIKCFYSLFIIVTTRDLSEEEKLEFLRIKFALQSSSMELSFLRKKIMKEFPNYSMGKGIYA